jgi:hypothetical protein
VPRAGWICHVSASALVFAILTSNVQRAFLYIHRQKQKACNKLLQAFDLTQILVGSASFELDF